MMFKLWPRSREGIVAVPRFSAEDVVRAGYEALLRRSPDASGLAAHSARLAANPDALSTLLHELMVNPESVRANAPALLGALGDVAQPVVSLGTRCFTSEFLKRQRLREWAGPFDWIFSNVAMIEHCVRDDFATFLDRALYRPVPLEERIHGPDVNRVDHLFYRDRFGVRNVFNHHDVHEDRDYAYLQRCVGRFRRALASPSQHVFLLFEADGSKRTLDQVKALAAALRDAGGGLHLLLAFLVDAERPTGLLPQARIGHEEPGLRVVHFASASPWLPLTFENPIDEVALAKLLRDAAVARAAPP